VTFKFKSLRIKCFINLPSFIHSQRPNWSKLKRLPSRVLSTIVWLQVLFLVSGWIFAVRKRPVAWFILNSFVHQISRLDLGLARGFRSMLNGIRSIFELSVHLGVIVRAVESIQGCLLVLSGSVDLASPDLVIILVLLGP